MGWGWLSARFAKSASDKGLRCSCCGREIKSSWNVCYQGSFKITDDKSDLSIDIKSVICNKCAEKDHDDIARGILERYCESVKTDN